MGITKYNEDNVRIMLERRDDHERQDIWEFNNGGYIRKPSTAACGAETIIYSCRDCSNIIAIGFDDAEKIAGLGEKLPSICPQCEKTKAKRRDDLFKIVFVSHRQL